MDKIDTDADRIKLFKKLCTESIKRYSTENYVSYPNIKISNIDYLYGGKYNYLLSDSKYHLFNSLCLNKYHKSDPLIIKYFIKKFKAIHILDCIIGSADQLIGSIASEISSYTGTDPDPCAHSIHLDIVNLLKPYGPNPDVEIQVYNSTYQDLILPPYIEFDLVYIAPADIKKTISSIKNGGHIIINGRAVSTDILSKIKLIPNLYYVGNMFYSDVFLNISHPIFIYEKNSQIPPHLYNPPISVSNIEHKNKHLHVIRDDYLTGGTKCRAVIQFIQHILTLKPNTTELIYLGASNGYAQVALAYGLYLLKSNLKLRLYAQSVPNLPEVNKLQLLTKYLYPNVTYIHLQKPFKEIWPLIDAYIKSNPTTYLLPFGMDDDIFKQLILDALLPRLAPFVDIIPRMWMVAGSGVLFSVLYRILSKTHFCVVQVGKEVNLSMYDQTRIILYKSQMKLYEAIKTDIPYATTKSYDGKIWEFESEFADGDWIWNVAGIHQKI